MGLGSAVRFMETNSFRGADSGQLDLLYIRSAKSDSGQLDLLYIRSAKSDSESVRSDSGQLDMKQVSTIYCISCQLNLIQSP